MVIKIAVPKRYSYRKMKKYANSYFGEKSKTIFNDKDKKYYVFLNHYGLDIKIINNDDEVRSDINQYLNYMFKDEYIGISHNNILNVENVKIYEV